MESVLFGPMERDRDPHGCDQVRVTTITTATTKKVSSLGEPSRTDVDEYTEPHNDRFVSEGARFPAAVCKEPLPN